MNYLWKPSSYSENEKDGTFGLTVMKIQWIYEVLRKSRTYEALH